MISKFLEGKRVLLAEDNEISQFVMKHAIEKLGSKVDVVGNGEEAVNKFAAGKYDLVLMDVQMPVMDGLEATREIREVNKHVPIVAISAFPRELELDKCLHAGMNEYLMKPFNSDSLKQIMEKTIATKSYKLLDDKIEIDLGVVYEVAANDQQYINLMINTFLNTMPLTLQSIREAWTALDYETMYKKAHYAKSSLSIIKVGDMFEKMVNIEKAGKTLSGLDTIESLVTSAEKQFADAKALLQSHFEYIHSLDIKQ